MSSVPEIQPMLSRLSPNLQGCVYMVMAMFGFTVNDLFVKYVGQSLPVYEIIAIRGVFICLILLAWLWILKLRGVELPPPMPKHSKGIVSVRAIMDVFATIFFLVALMVLPFGDVSAVMQSLPLAVTFGAAVFLKEPVGWRRWSAIIVGFIGVMVIIRPGFAGFEPAMLLVVVSVVFAAGRDLITKTLSSDIHSYWITLATAIAVALFGLISTTVLGHWQPVSVMDLVWILAAASFLTVGYLAIVLAMRIGEVASVAPFRYTSLLWAILFGYVVFAEIPDRVTIIGSCIVVGTGLFAWYRERQRAY